MAQRAIREFCGKSIISKHWEEYFSGFQYSYKSVLVTNSITLKEKSETHGFEWLKQENLVAKPDMLFGKRGKNGLVLFRDKTPGDITLKSESQWIDEKNSHDTILLSGEKGRLTHFIVEPFTPHKEEDEYYISATTVDEEDVLYISSQGGVEIEEDWEHKVTEIVIPIDMNDSEIEHIIRSNIPDSVPEENRERFTTFADQIFRS